MKKILKASLFAILGIFMLMPTTVFASSKNQVDENTRELMKTFPEFRESLEKNTTGELVGSKEVYIKYTPKKNVNTSRRVYENEEELKKDFDVKICTKEEYESERAKGSGTKRSINIGGVEQNYCSWLKMSLQVYTAKQELRNDCDVVAYNFCSWKTKPVFRFKDAIGISVSNGLVIDGGGSTRRASYNYSESGEGDTTINLPVTSNKENSGVLAQFTLSSPSYYNTEYNNAMISTGISFDGSTMIKGRISGNYLHTEVSVGSISLGATGIPSISGSISHDSHNASVSISR